MDTSTPKNRSSRVARPLTAAALATLSALMLSISVAPASADGLFLRKGAAAGENGAAARSRTGAFNGEGQGAFRRGGFASDGNGNGLAGFGRCANGVDTTACRGGAATWQDDGSFQRRLQTEIDGQTRSLSGQGALQRDADGAWTGNRTTDASGTNGAYTGAASLDEGTYNRGATYTGDEGQSASVDGTYERGSGGSRAVTCIDATGAIVDCP